MKKLENNKAIDPKLDRTTLIEGRDAGPGEAEYNYPLQGITVVASSQEEADRKVREIMKNKGVETKDIKNNVNTK